jgi:hypothetical protein
MDSTTSTAVGVDSTTSHSQNNPEPLSPKLRELQRLLEEGSYKPFPPPPARWPGDGSENNNSPKPTITPVAKPAAASTTNPVGVDTHTLNNPGADTRINPLIIATDERLRKESQYVETRMLENVLKHHYPDQEYIAPIDVLRECWDDANEYYANYRYPAHEVNDHEKSVVRTFQNNLEKHQDEVATQLLEESPEYQLRREAERLRQDKLAAEFEVNMATCRASQLSRRQHDMEVPQKGRVNIAILCHQMEDYHWEFFEQFFSKEYCGWNVQYDGQWHGYWFPKEVGDLSEILFSTTGTLFHSDGTEKGEKIPEGNYVMTLRAPRLRVSHQRHGPPIPQRLSSRRPRIERMADAREGQAGRNNR